MKIAAAGARISVSEERLLRLSGNPDALYQGILSGTLQALQDGRRLTSSQIREKFTLRKAVSRSGEVALEGVRGNADALRDYMALLHAVAREATTQEEGIRYRFQACMASAEIARIERMTPPRTRARTPMEARMQEIVDEEAGQRRKEHKPALEASKCVGRLQNESASLYGGLANSCGFVVNVAFCTFGAKVGTSAEAFDCTRTGGGLTSIPANADSTLHTKDAPQVVWAACQAPAYPMDLRRSESGIAHRCR